MNYVLVKKTMAIKAIFVLILISGLSTHVNSQDRNPELGFVAGFNLVDIRLTDSPPVEEGIFNPMVSFNANGYIGYRRGSFWVLSLEPGIIQKGYSRNAGDKRFRTQLNYIHMPVLADIYITDRIFISAGLEVGYMVNARAGTGKSSYRITGYYDNRFEVSALGGIGCRISERADIGLRYGHALIHNYAGLRDISGMPVFGVKQYNQYLQVVFRFRPLQLFSMENHSR